jgi:hypothetical protein
MIFLKRISRRLLLVNGSLFLCLNLVSCIYVPEKISQMFDNLTRDDEALKQKELELKERELAIKEQQAQSSTEQGQSVSQAGYKEISSSNNNNYSAFNINGRVTANGVQLRQDHSTTAQSFKSMKKNEPLQILEEFIPDGNYGEAILTQKTEFYDEYYGNLTFSLPKGKAVMVEGRSDADRYNITYIDAKTKRKGFAKINSNLLEFIAGKAWYRVKREDGLTGWVYSEFVQRF